LGAHLVASDDHPFGLVSFQVHAVGSKLESEGHDPDPLTLGTLHSQSCTSPRANQRALVLGEAIDDVPHEQGLWAVTVSRAVEQPLLFPRLAERRL
jgi:hypothetical protein